jgi:hypothetical protein
MKGAMENESSRCQLARTDTLSTLVTSSAANISKQLSASARDVCEIHKEIIAEWALFTAPSSLKESLTC